MNPVYVEHGIDWQQESTPPFSRQLPPANVVGLHICAQKMMGVCTGTELVQYNTAAGVAGE